MSKFLKSSRVVWRIAEHTPQATPEVPIPAPVLCVIAQDVVVGDAASDVVRRQELGLRRPDQPPVGSPGTPITELLNAQDAATLTNLLASTLTALCAQASIAPTPLTDDDVIAAAEERVRQLKAARAAKG